MSLFGKKFVDFNQFEDWRILKVTKVHICMLILAEDYNNLLCIVNIQGDYNFDVTSASA